MNLQSTVLAILFGTLGACASSAPSRTQTPDQSAPPTQAQPARDPQLPWWQGEEPLCARGTLKRRSLSWGALFWCVTSGARVDRSLQSDLSKLARCVHESVSAFQEEPEPDKLGLFLARAQESGLDPVLCAAVRRDGVVRTYHGRRVIMERRVESEGKEEMLIRYRFGCEDCLVSSETTVSVARKL